MSRLDDSEPKMQIPETWATKMSCPVCGSRPLGVFHPTGHADRFVCQSCETSFEIENNGTRVRFITLPQGVTPWLRASWVSLEEALSAFASHQNETLAIPPAAAPPAAPVELALPKPVAEPVVKPVVDAVPELVENPSSEVIETKPPATESLTETSAKEKVRQSEVTPQKDSQVPSFMANVHPANSPAGEAPKSPSSRSPFYEDDIDIPGIYPDRIRSEMEKPADEVWKNLEDERVRNLFLHPSAQEPSASLGQNNNQPIRLDLQIGRQEGFSSPVTSNQPSTLARPVSSSSEVEEHIDLNNPPPSKLVDDTPPSPISQPRTVPRNILPAEDLGVLRSQIAGQAVLPTLNEKMQTASQRALELQRLGNTENEVRSILERSSGLTPDEVAEVLKGLDKPEERKRSNRILFVFFAIASVIFMLIAWWFLSSINQEVPANQQPGVTETKSTGLIPGEIISAESLPGPLQTLIPNGVRILNDPVSVETSSSDAIPPTTCPKSKTEAAALFGGPAEDWNSSEQNSGWVLVSQQQSLVIKVPTNMTAGYLTFERGPEMRSVSGPAIVRNIYMISVSCQ